MNLRLAVFLLASAVPVFGTSTDTVHYGDLVIHAKVTGTVVPEDVFRLKSTIDGRVENVTVSSLTWHRADEPLALLANKEFAAMMDARGGQIANPTQDRWLHENSPLPVRCPQQCYLLKIYVKPHAWVKQNAVLFEAAYRLSLVARVDPQDAPLIRNGMTFTYWSAKNPDHRLTAPVEHFRIERRGGPAPEGTFTLEIPFGFTIATGMELEGEIIPLRKTNVLVVPTRSLIVDGGNTYLPVRVSTGATTETLTQITGGIEAGRPLLTLDDAQLRGVARHARTFERETIEERRGPATPTAPEPSASPKTDNDSYGGENPYGE